MNSAGCTRSGPRANQLAAPLAWWPINLSAISSHAVHHVDRQRHPLDEAVVDQADADTGRHAHARGTAAARPQRRVRRPRRRGEVPDADERDGQRGDQHQPPGDCLSIIRRWTRRAASARTLRGGLASAPGRRGRRPAAPEAAPLDRRRTLGPDRVGGAARDRITGERRCEAGAGRVSRRRSFSSKYFWITACAVGAASVPPWPPCSLSTTTAISGASGRGEGREPGVVALEVAHLLLLQPNLAQPRPPARCRSCPRRARPSAATGTRCRRARSPPPTARRGPARGARRR